MELNIQFTLEDSFAINWKYSVNKKVFLLK